MSAGTSVTDFAWFFLVQGAGYRVQGAGCRVQGVRCRVQGAGYRVCGVRCRVQGAGCRVRAAGCRACRVYDLRLHLHGRTHRPCSWGVARDLLLAESGPLSRKVDIRLPGKGNSNSHGARTVHQKHRWIRTSRLSIKNSLSGPLGAVRLPRHVAGCCPLTCHYPAPYTRNSEP
jgi:hypothetical protein